MSSSRFCAKALALVVMASSIAEAEAPRWLEWTAPPECPTARDIEQRVTDWLGGALPASGDLRVKTGLSWTAERWDVSVDVAFGGHSGRRQVSVTSCSDAADFVAVAVALAVDPTLAERNAGAPSGPLQQPVAESHDTEPVAEPKAAPARPPAPDVPKARPSSTLESSARPHLSGALDVSAGVLPEPCFGPAVSLGVDLGRLTLALGGRWFPAVTTSPEQAQAPIDFSLLDARLVAAYRFFGPEAELGPSLFFGGGAIYAEQQTATSNAVREPWLSLGAGLAGALALHREVSLFSELELGIPLTQPSFVLSDGSEVHRARYGFSARFGARFFLGRW